VTRPARDLSALPAECYTRASQAQEMLQSSANLEMVLVPGQPQTAVKIQQER
jgi:hypothetical protein